MKSVAYAYIKKREYSTQECVYHILSGKWLRKHSLVLDLPTVIVLEKRTEYFLETNKFCNCHKNR